MLIEWQTDDFLNSIKDAINVYKEKAHTGMEQVGQKILEQAKQNSLIKYDTGLMEENSNYEVQDNPTDITSIIGFMEFYSIYVHQGTGIYAIDGRQTPWWWKGTTEKWQGWHKTVGQKPAPFLQDALEELEEEIPLILQEAMNG